jgi:hypothetical protein
MTKADPGDDELHQQAREFADDLGRRLDRVLDDVPPMTVLLRAGHRPRLHISPRPLEEPLEIATIPLRVASKHRLNLRIEMNCTWDSSRQFLTLEDSKVAVETLGEGTRAQPIMRYEYERNSPLDIRCAHLHVHAHRDEATWMMTLGQRGRARARVARDSMPVLSEFHFPLGGHRFRPCVEDVVEVLVDEFGVETRDAEWRSVLREGRADWRRKQVAAAVRDCPQQAAKALRHRGWVVSPPPEGGGGAEDLARLTAL